MPEDTDPPITRLGSHIAWESPWYRVRADRVRWPDGSTGVYNVVEKAPSVFIVPVTHTGDIVLIHSYRHPLGRWCWELPAGAIEPGQTPQQAAAAELLQETGGSAAHWRHLATLPTMNGTGDHLAHFFLATCVTLGAPNLEHTEALRVQPTARADAIAMALSGQMQDAVSVAALLMAAPLLE